MGRDRAVIWRGWRDGADRYGPGEEGEDRDSGHVRRGKAGFDPGLVGYQAESA